MSTYSHLVIRLSNNHKVFSFKKMILIGFGYFARAYDQRLKHSVEGMRYKNRRDRNISQVSAIQQPMIEQLKVCVLELECVLCINTRSNSLYRFITKPTPFSFWMRCIVISIVMANIVVHYTRWYIQALACICLVFRLHQCRAFVISNNLPFFIRINIIYKIKSTNERKRKRKVIGHCNCFAFLAFLW